MALVQTNHGRVLVGVISITVVYMIHLSKIGCIRMNFQPGKNVLLAFRIALLLLCVLLRVYSYFCKFD